jgi:hypothetical protein
MLAAFLAGQAVAEQGLEREAPAHLNLMQTDRWYEGYDLASETEDQLIAA